MPHLAERGRRVLLVDLDQQGSLTISLGCDPDALEATIYTVLSAHADPKEKNPPPLSSIVRPTATPAWIWHRPTSNWRRWTWS